MEKNGSEDDSTRMTLGEHLEELRKRLFWALLGLGLAMCITLPCGKYILRLLAYPYKQMMIDAGLEPDLTVLTLVGGITVYIRVALVSGLVLASPWVFHQLWQFIAAGLYSKEKRYVHYAVPCSAGLFLIGAAFFLFVVSNQMFKFFIWFNTVFLENVEMVITFDKYITLVCLMMLVFGVAFQTPLAVLLLAKMGLVTTKTLNRYRKHVIVGMLILAALFTSPSPVDQVLLAVPMWLLYEMGVLLAYFLVERKREEEVE